MFICYETAAVDYTLVNWQNCSVFLERIQNLFSCLCFAVCYCFAACWRNKGWWCMLMIILRHVPWEMFKKIFWIAANGETQKEYSRKRKLAGSIYHPSGSALMVLALNYKLVGRKATRDEANRSVLVVNKVAVVDAIAACTRWRCACCRPISASATDACACAVTSCRFPFWRSRRIYCGCRVYRWSPG